MMDNSIIPTPRRRNGDLKLWLMWVIASTAAILLSIVVLYALIFIAIAISPGINEDRLFGGSMFPVMAGFLGVCQWLVLRRYIPRAGWWILATIVGLWGGMALANAAVQAFGHIVGQEEFWNFRPGTLMFSLLIGFLLALAQLPILWHHFRGALLWLLASLTGWFVLGLILGVSINGPAEIFAVGAIPAMFTGSCLIWLMRNPRIIAEPAPDPTMSPQA